MSAGLPRCRSLPLTRKVSVPTDGWPTEAAGAIDEIGQDLSNPLLNAHGRDERFASS